MNTSNLKSFNYLENGEVMFSNYDTVKSSKKLDPDFYDIEFGNSRVCVKINNNKESFKSFDFQYKKKLDDLFEAFFKPEIIDKIKSLKFYHKLGILLEGIEGSGKTTMIRYYSNKFKKERDALVFYINEVRYLQECWDFIKSVREIQDNPIVIIFEEFDSLIYNGNESILKTIMDGPQSIDDCIFFATTNYIDKIPDSLKNRKSRFKLSLKVDQITDTKVIFGIIEEMISDLFDTDEMVEFSKELENTTLDQIKQFCIDKIMNLDTYEKMKSNAIGFVQKEKEK